MLTYEYPSADLLELVRSYSYPADPCYACGADHGKLPIVLEDSPECRGPFTICPVTGRPIPFTVGAVAGRSK